MDFKQLESFVNAVELKSFTEAADVLFLSQPTISTHIRALEIELNTQLIKRTTKTFGLTDEGQRFYDYAVNLINLRNKMTAELKEPEREEVYIGVSSIPGKYLLPEVLGEFHQKEPTIAFNIQHSDSLDVIQKVTDGQYDLGFVGTKTDAPLIFEPFAEDELVVAMPNTPHYRQMIQDDIHFKDLIHESILVRSDDSGTRVEAERWLHQMGLEQEVWNVIARINDPEMLLNCIGAGLGISIISRLMVPQAHTRKDILTFVPRGAHLKRTLYLVYSDKRRYPQVSRKFLSFLKKRIAGEEEYVAPVSP